MFLGLEATLKAAEQGDARTQYRLGRKYEVGGRGLPNDEAEAVKWYRKSAEQGLAKAQYGLGRMYDDGAPQHYTEAAKWYRKAAEQGFAAAQYNLGFMYLIGQGVPENDVEAVKWYRKAAEQGYALAHCSLGSMYRTGSREVPKDEVEAYALFSVAAANGNKYATNASPKAKAELTPEQLTAAEKRIEELTEQINANKAK